MQLETILFISNIALREHTIAVFGDPAQNFVVGVDCNLHGRVVVWDLVVEVYYHVGTGAGGAEGHARWAAGCKVGIRGQWFTQAEFTWLEATGWWSDVSGVTARQRNIVECIG